MKEKPYFPEATDGEIESYYRPNAMKLNIACITIGFLGLATAVYFNNISSKVGQLYSAQLQLAEVKNIHSNKSISDRIYSPEIREALTPCFLETEQMQSIDKAVRLAEQELDTICEDKELIKEAKRNEILVFSGFLGLALGGIGILCNPYYKKEEIAKGLNDTYHPCEA